MFPIVVTFTGQSGAGKDTCASFCKKYFEKHDKRCLELHYADLLKSIIKNNDFEGSYREQMQYFGTDVVRAIEPNFWVEQTWHTIDLLGRRREDDYFDSDDNLLDYEKEEKKALEHLKYDVFLIPDARFENELKPKYHDLNNFIVNVKVNRDNPSDKRITEQERQHESEQLSINYSDENFDVVITNNKDLAHLEESCEYVVNKILTWHKEYEKHLYDNFTNLYEQVKKEGGV